MARPFWFSTSWYLAAVTLGLAMIAPSAHADAIKVSATTWNTGDQITVTGTDLYGTYIRLRRLCFASIAAPDSLSCFGHYDADNKVWVNEDDPYLVRWDQNRIEFKVPATLPAQGTL
jgi:hypothetical protein